MTPPLVVLDSNVLFGRNPFSRPHMKVLLAGAKRDQITLVIPDVVLRELSRQWHEDCVADIEKLRQSINSANKVLNDVGYGPLDAIPLPRTLDPVIFYDHARAILLDHKVTIAPLPGVSVASLLDRDLETRKPFDKSGKGFRDALVWETVLELLREGGPTDQAALLVTNNSRDFGGNDDGAVHVDLLPDLPDPTSIAVLPSIAAVLGHEAVKHILARGHQMEAAGARDAVVQRISEAFDALIGEMAVNRIGEYVEDGEYAVSIPVEVEDPSFENLDPDYETLEVETYELDDDSFIVSASVVAECTFEGYVYKSDYFAFEYHSINILEDWNSHMFRAEQRINLRITLGSQTIKFGDDSPFKLQVMGAEEARKPTASSST